jgi:DNA-binding SARP family transcriptional activator
MHDAGQQHGPASTARLVMLGSFELSVDGRRLPLPTSGQRLVALLALRGPTRRSRVAGALWPDVDEQRALARLRTAVWRVSQVVPGLVVSPHGELGLQDLGPTDVSRLVEASRAVLAGERAPDGLEPVGWDRELLPDWDEEWINPDRERLRQLRLHVLEVQAARLMAEGSYGLALDGALSVLRADPLRESAYRMVMQVHLQEGNVAEAWRTYGECETVLARELGVAPSVTTAAMVPRGVLDRAVLRQRAVTDPRTGSPAAR